MKLIGDIGGTKVLLALAADDGRIDAQRRFASAEFADFDALLGAFLTGLDAPIDGGCLAVAGPVADDGRSAKITNLPWRIDSAVLETRFGLGPLQLVNDFVGAAFGVTALGAEHLVCLQGGEALAHGVKLVIGAGTGLGMATVIHDDNGWRVLPGEGGHIGFAPEDDAQLQVWSALHQAYGRVTAERVISGPGLAAIHRIRSGEALDPAHIAAQALASPASAAGLSLQLFLAAYGAFAGDMAMAVMARGGVYLAGGIAAKILPLMASGPFLQHFNAKAEHADLVARMPVYVVTDAQLGLHGAALLAMRPESPALR